MQIKFNDWDAIRERYATPFAWTYVFVVIVYSYFFTTLTFTNHTFPNIWVFSYPSYRTYNEGRWFADFLIFLFGGSGVQSFQMFIAVGIQIINAFLFAIIIEVKDKTRLFLIAAFLSIHPAFLDYYSFAVDHISFTFGDTLALLGILALKKVKKRWLGSLAATCLFILSIATYQPKIAFIALLLVLFRIQELFDQSDKIAFRKSLQFRYIPAGLAFFLALILYYISTIFITIKKFGIRTNTNNISEIYNQIVSSYSEFFSYYTMKVDYLPSCLHLLPLLCVIIGCTLLLIKVGEKGKYSLLELILLLALLPITLRSSYIINSKTWITAGRIIAPYAYCLLFFIFVISSFSYWRKLSKIIICIFLYFFIIIGTQQTNEAYLKTIYEFNKINRIVARIETVAPELYQRKYGLIIVGNLKLENQKLMKYPNEYHVAHVRSETFAAYRQVQILNFYLGKDVFARVTKKQQDSILPTLQGKSPWPSPESVSEQDGIIVVLLKRFTKKEPITWTTDNK